MISIVIALHMGWIQRSNSVWLYECWSLFIIAPLRHFEIEIFKKIEQKAFELYFGETAKQNKTKQKLSFFVKLYFFQKFWK